MVLLGPWRVDVDLLVCPRVGNIRSKKVFETLLVVVARGPRIVRHLHACLHVGGFSQDA